MKRLIIVCMILLSTVIDATEPTQTAIAPVISQSSDEKTSTNTDDASVLIANVHQINLDTTEIDGGGNWLNKRIWYERSQAIFDEIRVLATTVDAIRTQFTNEVNAVGQKIDSFWESVDFTRAQLEDTFKDILEKLDAEQKLVGDLSVDERNLQTTVKQELSTIDQLGKDIKVIHDIDEKIDQTLAQAFKTVDECHDFESKAWDTFKSIGKELDDKKARTLYYQMHNYKENIDQKNKYLKATLLPYLHNILIAKVEMNISKINQTIDQLKTKGIDLDKIMNKYADEDILQLHAREKEATQIAVKNALEEEQAKAKLAADTIAQESKKALEDANKNSFTNVMNHYYEETFGKVVAFFHQGYLGAFIDYIRSCFSFFFSSYSYPIFTYCSHAFWAIKTYIENCVHDVMIYFGGKVVKAEIKEKIAEKVEQIEKSGDGVQSDVIDTIKEKVSEKIAEKVEEHVDVEKSQSSDVIAPSTDASVAKAEDKTATTSAASDSSAAGIATATPLLAIGDTSPTESAKTDEHAAEQKSTDTKTAESSETKKDTVVVQSMNNETDNQLPRVSNAYHVFKSFLDCIGTIFVSMYNCIAQIFTFLWKISTYISSN